MTDFRDWLTTTDDPVAQQDAEARRLIPDVDPASLHAAGSDARETLDLAQELLSRGFGVRQIPIEDPSKLRQMVDSNAQPDSEPNLADDLNDLGDGIDQFENDARARGVDPDDAVADLTQFDEEHPPLHLASTRRAQLEDRVAPPDEELPPADGDPPVEEPEEETLEDLLGRLESAVDAMGDDTVDPTLAAAATIIARRLLAKLGEMTMDSAGVPPEEPEPSLDEELATVKSAGPFTREEVLEAGRSKLATAARLIHIADRLDSLEIPVIPDLVDECLIRVAARDYESYEHDFPKRPWTEPWKHSEGPLEKPRRKPVGIDSGGLSALRERNRKSDSHDQNLEVVDDFVQPHLEIDRVPTTTLDAIRSLAASDRRAFEKASADLMAQLLKRPPQNVPNAVAKLRAIGAEDKLDTLLLIAPNLAPILATSNSDNIREAGGRQPDPVADPFEIHRIRRHVLDEDHSIPTELKDEIVANGLATEDEFEPAGPDQWRHLNTKYERYLRNVGDTMKTLTAGKSNVRRRLQEIVRQRLTKDEPTKEEDTPVLEIIRRREEEQRRFPAKDFTRSAQVMNPNLDEVSNKLVDILLSAGGLQSLGVAKKLGVSQSTAKRILNRLSQAGIVVQDAMAIHRKDGTGGRQVFWRLSDQFKANYTPPIEESNNQKIEQSNGEINPTTNQPLEYSNSPSLEQSSDRPLEQSSGPMGGEITAEPLAAAAGLRRRVKFAQVLQRMTAQQCQICGGQVTEDSLTGEMACQDCGMPAEVLPENMTNQEAGQLEDFTPEMEPQTV